jgi:hypothetical protein
MPFKHHADHRHRFPRAKYRVTNWSAYEAGLHQRGSLTVWFSAAAVAAWQAEARRTPGGQPLYSALAIETALTLRALFHLAFRQTEGLIGSLLQLLQLDLPVPDHSTLSRRARTLAVAPWPQVTGPLHLLVDAERGRMAWQKTSGYNARARVEVAIQRFKQVVGDRLRAHSDEGRRTEVIVACNLLNRLFDLARPTYARVP